MGRQSDPLGFPTGQGPGRPTQCQVLDPNVLHKGQPVEDFLEDWPGNLLVLLGQLYLLEEVNGITDGEVRYLADVLTRDFYSQRPLIQPVAVAGWTRQLGHVLAHLLPGEVRIGFPVTAFNVVDDPLKGYVDVPHAAKVIFVVEVESLVAIAVEDQLLLLLRQLIERRVHIDAD